MTKRAFDKIAEGLREAIGVARGEAQAYRIHVPPEIDIKSLRRRLKLSQAEFANEYGFSLSQVRDWEQGRTHPLGALRAYLAIIAKDPLAVRALLRQEPEAAVRGGMDDAA